MLIIASAKNVLITIGIILTLISPDIEMLMLIVMTKMIMTILVE